MPIVVQSLVFADGGGSLIASMFGDLLLIDPVGRTVLTSRALSSPAVPDPNDRPGTRALLMSQVRESIWAWDDADHSLVGVVQLASTGKGQTGLAVWRPARGAPQPIATEQIVSCQPLAMSRDRRLVAVRVTKAGTGCEHARAIQVFDLTTRSAATPPIEVGAFALAAAFSPSGRLVATGGLEASAAYLYDIANAHLDQVAAAGGIRSIAYHPSLPLIAWATVTGALESWRPGSPAAVPRGIGEAVAISPDGRYLATVSRAQLSLRDPATFRAIGPPATIIGSVNAIAFSDDSAQVAVAAGSTAGAWQLRPGRRDTAADRDWFSQLRALPLPEARPPPPIARDGAIDGVVRLDGKPIANAEVTLTPHPAEYADARALPPITARTGADGRFRFADVPTILWQQITTAPGATSEGRLYDLRARTAHHGDVALERAVTIIGTVLGPDRRPAHDVRVYHPTGTDLYDGVDIAVDARTGRFTIDHLRPNPRPTDRYWITARRADGAVRSQALDTSTPGPIRITLALLPRTDPRVLQVQVVDAAGAPVANAPVAVEGQPAKTDAHGMTSLDYDSSRTGAKHLTARVDDDRGYARGTASVDLPSASPLTISLTR
jgi:WD40 repeat protein